MNKATTKLLLSLDILAGIIGIEHGIGEVLEGSRPTEGVLHFIVAGFGVF